MSARSTRQQQNLLIGRDESWMQFNRRVLEEAQDRSNPLLERVKFLAITASNLDEFVEIRVAGVMQRIEDGYNEVGPDGLTPEQTFDRDTSELRTFVESQYRCWNKSLRPALHAAGIRVLDYAQMTGEQLEYASQFYQREVDPL